LKTKIGLAVAALMIAAAAGGLALAAQGDDDVDNDANIGDANAVGLPLLTVDRIEPGIDGYTAYLTDSIGGGYTAVISIPNLEDAFVPLEVGDVVTIAGDYAESSPVQILNVRNITVE
jgi:hypothetical protein